MYPCLLENKKHYTSLIGRIATIVIHSRYTMHSKDKISVLSCLAATIIIKKRRKQKKSIISKRKEWCKDWVNNKKLSSYSTIFKELGAYMEDIQNYIRMPRGVILASISNSIMPRYL